MKFYTNKDNSDYLMVNVKLDFAYLLVSDNIDIPIDVFNQMNKIYADSFRKDTLDDLNIFSFPDEVGILKNSLVGKFLLNNSDRENIINFDEYISYKDVVNAFNIAVYEDDCKMSNKVLKLFKERSSGFIDELKEDYCDEVIDYISSNRDFDMYLKKREETYVSSEYIVYEDDKFVNKYLNVDNKVKVKKYGD